MPAKKLKIKPDPRNVNRHDDRSHAAVGASLDKLGAGRSIVIDAEDTIIGGECTYQEAVKLGLPLRIIESDGKTLIVVKRTDLKTNDPRRRALAIADNKTSTLSSLDFAAAGKELNALTSALAKLKVEGLDVSVTGFAITEAASLAKPSTAPAAAPAAIAASARADRASAGLQSDGKNVYFGQDQFEVVNRFIAYAHSRQGDEASDAECIVWGLLSLLEGSGF